MKVFLIQSDAVTPDKLKACMYGFLKISPAVFELTEEYKQLKDGQANCRCQPKDNYVPTSPPAPSVSEKEQAQPSTTGAKIADGGTESVPVGEGNPQDKSPVVEGVDTTKDN